MLVTFKTSAYSDITMFGTAATSLLRMMGQSGNVPGAILAGDIPAALDKLKKALAEQSDDTLVPAHEASEGAGLLGPDSTGQPPIEDSDDVKPVPLATRATPLIELLEAAHAAGESVIWDEN